ncbi:DUF2332 family protein [Anaeromyxobacter oryzae]|uniref:DUF2332 domain-containing protein n=1 Tax=Anaeromyxobacter oryzae TaxID=2918170 RepID=A0ABM7WV58_9BACT|nr:DUF2332 family protein [Anaeromyxobacter oryzae]BDG03394.1 hypothetical protein AMOR_23900 [Anaeromyxobacter oryzae]
MTSPRTVLAGLADELARERPHVAPRSEPYARALDLLPGVLDGAEGRFVAAAWEHRTFFAWYDRPLLLLAALRADARAEGPGHPLYEGFASPEPRAEAVTAEALRAGLAPERERVYDALAHRGVSTNETARAVAWLWPAALAGASSGGRALALADVGASAGLNLVADALPDLWTFQDGAPVETARGVRAVARLGLDSAPLDALRAEDQEWLRACVWPGEGERAARLEEALAAFAAARARPDAPVLVPIAARNVPARLDLLCAAQPGALVLAYQTLLRDFLEPTERAEYEAGMSEWLSTHPSGQALWVELEAGPAGRHGDEAAELIAHVRGPDGRVRALALARCGFHPRRLVRDEHAVGELRTLAGPQAAVSLGA